MESRDEDVQKLSSILDVVADKVPALINQLKSSLYSAEAGRELGKAVGAFYQELVASGIPAADALEMCRGYIGAMHSALKQIKAE